MNYSAYFAIEKKLKLQGFNFDRSELVAQFTDGKKSGLKELTDFEYSEFLKMLNSRFVKVEPSRPPVNEVLQNQRRKIISLFRKMGYEKEHKADMERIYKWVLEYGYLHKGFNQYNENELPKLVTQVEIIYKKFLRDENNL